MEDQGAEAAPLLSAEESDSKPFYYSVNRNASDAKPIVSHEERAVPWTANDLSSHFEAIANRQQERPVVPVPDILYRGRNEGQENLPRNDGKHHSVVTVFAIWNTMLGTSILAMPWALQQAGLVCGIFLMIFMAGLCLYTAYRIVNVQKCLGFETLPLDYSDVCRSLLGRWGEIISFIFSICSLLGATAVYWVLMSNFLYNTVKFIADDITHHNVSMSHDMNEVVCWIKQNTTAEPDANAWSYWSLKVSPIYLSLIALPLVSFKSATFFTRFNAFGAVSIIFIVIFVVLKAVRWHINAEFVDVDSPNYIPLFYWRFPDLAGILSLSYFIHNVVTSILRNQKKPENNTRDLSVAYCLVALTYMLVGILFYISFPLPKSCITDNLLNNLTNEDLLSFIARIFLFVQMMTVFPLLVYMIRIQFFTQFWDNRDPSWKLYIPMNVLLLALTCLVAIFYPRIGEMIRYTGAICGLAYSYTLPCITYMAYLRLCGLLTKRVIAVHVAIIAIGVANVIGQVVMSYI